jgi:hypothetical protein
MVQARTRIMNQLQAVALNEGLRCKKRLWHTERPRLESFPLPPWASRRRHDLLELLDRLNSTIAELSQAMEQEVEKCPEAQRLATHPGVEVRSSSLLVPTISFSTSCELFSDRFFHHLTAGSLLLYGRLRVWWLLRHLLRSRQLRTIPATAQRLNQRHRVSHLLHLKTVQGLLIR